MSLARRTLAAAVLIGASFGWSVAAHAQAVVIRSTGPSAAAYPMGRKLPAGALQPKHLHAALVRMRCAYSASGSAESRCVLTLLRVALVICRSGGWSRSTRCCWRSACRRM